MELDKLFKPQSVAVYGVSNDIEKIGSTIFFNLIASGFEGELYPINPKHSEILGHKCYPNVQAISSKVDLAIMAIPAQQALDVLEDCCAKKVTNLVIISAGFSEVGETGKKLEELVTSRANECGITLLGPNCLGLIVSESKMNASFAAANCLPGDIAFLSQSGAVCTAILDLANKSNLGFSHFISVGNKSNLNENHLVEKFLLDDDVRVIGAYLEEFASGRRFCELKDVTDIEKPIVVITPGESDAAKEAISSHTGSLVSPTKVINSALAKNGIVKVATLTQLYALMMGFSWGKIPSGKNVAILTNAGGAGILSADEIVASEMNVVDLSETTEQRLREVLPETSSIKNPVDVIGDAKADRYESALKILIEAPEVDSILVILTPQLVTEIEDTSKLLIAMAKQTEKPIIPIFLGGDYIEAGIRRMHHNETLCFDNLNTGIFVLDKLGEYGDYVRMKEKSKHLNYSELKDERSVDLELYVKDELLSLPETLVKSLTDSFDLVTPKTSLVKTFDEAKQNAHEFGYPVVVKATTDIVVHKTDVQAVFLNITSDDDLAAKCQTLQENLQKITGKAENTFIIQEQIKADLELFIGVKRDGGMRVYSEDSGGFGYLVLFGTGGIYTEIYEDLSFGVLPMQESDFATLIEQPRVAKIVNGYRGKQLAKQKIIETLMNLQRMLFTYPEIAEVDLNPVMLSSERCVLADVKIFLKR